MKSSWLFLLRANETKTTDTGHAQRSCLIVAWFLVALSDSSIWLYLKSVTNVMYSLRSWQLRLRISGYSLVQTWFFDSRCEQGRLTRVGNVQGLKEIGRQKLMISNCSINISLEYERELISFSWIQNMTELVLSHKNSNILLMLWCLLIYLLHFCTAVVIFEKGLSFLSSIFFFSFLSSWL